MTTADFGISEEERSGVTVLDLRGEIDVSTAPELRRRLTALAEDRCPLVVANLIQVTFVDSTALGVLVSAVKQFRSDGGDLRLVVTQPHITKVLEVTGLDNVFRVFASTAEAVAG